MEEKPKKILIACPTLGLDPDPTKWLTSLLTIINDIRRAKMTHACLFPYRTTWWPANNQIWQVAFENEFDYILRVDDDIWGVQPGHFSKLLESGKDVIGACYPMRGFPYSNAALVRQDKSESIIDSHKNRYTKASLEEVIGTGVHPCDLIGFGMTLIKVEPFLLIDRPIYKGTEVCPDDSYFAQVCIDNGIQQYVNMDVKICHREVTPLNRGYLFNAEARAMIHDGAIRPGTAFSDRLINAFGPDGMKDFSQLKGFEPSRIITR